MILFILVILLFVNLFLVNVNADFLWDLYWIISFIPLATQNEVPLKYLTFIIVRSIMYSAVYKHCSFLPMIEQIEFHSNPIPYEEYSSYILYITRCGHVLFCIVRVV